MVSNRIAEAAVARMNVSARAKTYVGFSDCGYLLAALYRAGIGQSVHGSMPVSARSEGGREAIRRVLRWFGGDTSGVEPSLDGSTPAAAFNLITLAMIAGTPMMPDLTGHVVMVEEVSEHIYAIDRLFFHLAALLPRVAGPASRRHYRRPGKLCRIRPERGGDRPLLVRPGGYPLSWTCVDRPQFCQQGCALRACQPAFADVTAPAKI